MYYNLCKVYRDPDGPRNKKDSSKPYNGVIREHEGNNLFLIILTSKGINQEFKQQKTSI